MDTYAATYLVFLLITIAVALKWGHRARIMGVAILACSWSLVMLARPIGIEAPILTFATIDFVIVFLFASIGGHYDRTWAIWVAAFHTAMLATHLTYVVLFSYSQFVYLSILSALSYASLLAIAGPLILNRIFGNDRHVASSPAYLRYVSLGRWEPYFGNKRSGNPKK